MEGLVVVVKQGDIQGLFQFGNLVVGGCNGYFEYFGGWCDFCVFGNSNKGFQICNVVYLFFLKVGFG